MAMEPWCASEPLQRTSLDTAAPDGALSEKTGEYLSQPYEHSRLSCVYRSAADTDAWPKVEILGVDFHTVARILRHDPTFEIDQVLIEKDLTPAQSYIRLNDFLSGNLTMRQSSYLPVTKT